ncbi:hypothetical protein CSUI_002085, partial [Cystoisospora suis]
ADTGVQKDAGDRLCEMPTACSFSLVLIQSRS